MSWSELAAAIGKATGRHFAVRSANTVGGGCIHAAMVVSDGERRYFVKRNRIECQAMFEAEARGLDALGRAGGARVPAVLHCGVCDDNAVLVLECIDMHSLAGGAARRLGEALAVQHAVTGRRFGLDTDNFIGATPQSNAPADDWATFFRDRRLRPQLDMAAARGHGGVLQARGRRLLEEVGGLLAGHDPVPSLLHGDLWGGNAAADADGRPVLFDPAVYHGDREADLAMTELFGGFGTAFRAAYEAAWPLPAGYPTRRTLYNLYHVLNHLNLFGAGYLESARQDIDRLLAETR